MCLTGHGWWDGSGVDPTTGKSTGKQLAYVAFGAAVCEVEFDVLTGEKVVLCADILYDCGHSLNPAADIGQVNLTFCEITGNLEKVESGIRGRSGPNLSAINQLPLLRKNVTE